METTSPSLSQSYSCHEYFNGVIIDARDIDSKIDFLFSVKSTVSDTCGSATRVKSPFTFNLCDTYDFDEEKADIPNYNPDDKDSLLNQLEQRIQSKPELAKLAKHTDIYAANEDKVEFNLDFTKSWGLSVATGANYTFTLSFQGNMMTKIEYLDHPRSPSTMTLQPTEPINLIWQRINEPQSHKIVDTIYQIYLIHLLKNPNWNVSDIVSWLS